MVAKNKKSVKRVNYISLTEITSLLAGINMASSGQAPSFIKHVAVGDWRRASANIDHAVRHATVKKVTVGGAVAIGGGQISRKLAKRMNFRWKFSKNQGIKLF